MRGSHDPAQVPDRSPSFGEYPAKWRFLALFGAFSPGSVSEQQSATWVRAIGPIGSATRARGGQKPVASGGDSVGRGPSRGRPASAQHDHCRSPS